MTALSHREILPSRVKTNSKQMAASSRQAFPAYCLRVMAHCMHTREMHRMRPVLARDGADGVAHGDVRVSLEGGEQ